MPWAPDYIQVQTLADYLKITDINDNDELAFSITGASRAIDLHTNRQFGLVDTPELRKFLPEFRRRKGQWIIEIDDLMTETGLVIELNSGQQITDFTLLPLNASEKSIPWETISIDKESSVFPSSNTVPINITGQWGWTEIPGSIEQATLLQASRIFARRTSPWGIAGTPDLGSELRLQERLDPDVAVTLGPFIRWWGAV